MHRVCRQATFKSYHLENSFKSLFPCQNAGAFHCMQSRKLKKRHILQSKGALKPEALSCRCRSSRRNTECHIGSLPKIWYVFHATLIWNHPGYILKGGSSNIMPLLQASNEQQRQSQGSDTVSSSSLRSGELACLRLGLPDPDCTLQSYI